MSVRNRVIQALAANTFGQAVTIGSQLLLVPLYFRYWGAATYGEWLVLFSIPAYLMMADLGIGTAAGNEMTIKVGARDFYGASRTYNSARRVSLYSGLLVLLAGLCLAAFKSETDLPETKLINKLDACLIIFVLSANVALGFTLGLISNTLRADGRNALGVTLFNLTRLIEALVMAGALLLNKGPVFLCLSALAAKGVMSLVQLILLQKTCFWLQDSKADRDPDFMRRLLRPALGFMAFPIGNALILQGPVIVIGHVYGGASVALFSALRTLTRIPIQFVNMLNSSVWPELSRAHGSGNITLLRSLHRRTLAVSALAATLCALVLGFIGEHLSKLWLGSSILFDWQIFVALLAVTVISSVWNASLVVLSATNQHTLFGGYYIGATGICLTLMFLLSSEFGWIGILIPLVSCEIVLAKLVLCKSLPVTADTASAMWSDLHDAFISTISALRKIGRR